MNSFIMVLSIILIILQGIGIYLLLVRKRFKFTSDSGTHEVEKFLNILDEEMAVKANMLEKHTQQMIESLKEHEHNRLNTVYEFKANNEDLAKTFLETLTANQQELKKIVSILNDMLKEHLSDVSNKLGMMKEELNAVKDLTEEKDRLIRRYEEGYDRKIVKNFTEEIFDVLDYIKKEKNNATADVIEEVEEDITLLLDKNGIQVIEINEGDPYKNLTKYAKVIGTEETDDEEKNMKIKQVKKQGYMTEIDEGKQKVLRPAEVVVYKFKVGGEK